MTDVALVLGCTHYGYRAPLFREAFQAHGVSTCILDPNEAMATAVVDMVTRLGGPPSLRSTPEIRFWSRYPLPPTEVATISGYLQVDAPVSAAAVRSYRLEPALFACRQT